MGNVTRAITHCILNSIYKTKAGFLPGEDPADRYKKIFYFLAWTSVEPSSLLLLLLSKDIRVPFNHTISELEENS